MRAGTSEYDRFGPWIDDVTTLEEVPPLYRDHPLDLERARLVLKVPRNIARRDATPDMDLYDHLLLLDEVGLTVLSRRLATGSRRAPVARGYDVTSVPYSQVVAVLETINLLDGRLTIFTRVGAALSVRYNGSARENVARLVSAIRVASEAYPPSAVGRALLKSAARTAALPVLDPGDADIVFVNDFEELARHHAGLAAWTCHGRVATLPRGGGWAGAARRVAHLFAPATLQGAIVAGDHATIEIVGRREWFLPTRKPVYSRSRLVLPLGALEWLDVAPHGRYVGVSVVRVGAGAASVEIAVPEDSAAFRLFTGALAPRSRLV
jgi:hypothetical protein